MKTCNEVKYCQKCPYWIDFGACQKIKSYEKLDEGLERIKNDINEDIYNKIKILIDEYKENGTVF